MTVTSLGGGELVGDRLADDRKVFECGGRAVRTFAPANVIVECS